MGSLYLHILLRAWSNLQLPSRDNCIGSLTSPLKGASGNQGLAAVIQAPRTKLIAGRSYMLRFKGSTVDRKVCFIPNSGSAVGINKSPSVDDHNPFSQIFHTTGFDTSISSSILYKQSPIIFYCIMMSCIKVTARGNSRRKCAAVEIQLHILSLGYWNVTIDSYVVQQFNGYFPGRLLKLAKELGLVIILFCFFVSYFHFSECVSICIRKCRKHSSYHTQRYQKCQSLFCPFHVVPPFTKLRPGSTAVSCYCLLLAKDRSVPAHLASLLYHIVPIFSRGHVHAIHLCV